MRLNFNKIILKSTHNLTKVYHTYLIYLFLLEYHEEDPKKFLYMLEVFLNLPNEEHEEL